MNSDLKTAPLTHTVTFVATGLGPCLALSRLPTVYFISYKYDKCFAYFILSI